MFRRNSDIDRRARCLKPGRRGTGPVVYWMERDQRIGDNWALLWARQEAMDRHTDLVVVFCFDRGYPGAGLRSNIFGLKGLDELARGLNSYRIGFRVLVGSPREQIPAFLKGCDAHVLITDFNPLWQKRRCLEELTGRLPLPLYEIDAHNIVPAWIVTDRKEYGAYTLRPRITGLLDLYLTDIPVLEPLGRDGFTQNSGLDIAELLKRTADRQALEIDWLEPGETAACRAMQEALSRRLPSYGERRNDPCVQGQSGLSPYLHFGQLSAQRLAWQVSQSGLSSEDNRAFLEELIVRRELSDNYCLFEPRYDSFGGFPSWARKTLEEHRKDERQYSYSLDELEAAKTHEELWNACQRDLVKNGKLHGYLRMYWAKKILEWTAEPEAAQEYAIVLNDRYSLDGCDPNGYTGIAWSIGGVHDRAWKERKIFGKIRYMNERGCRRKFDVDSYISSIADS